MSTVSTGRRIRVGVFMPRAPAQDAIDFIRGAVSA
jgi:hypothetical protein